MSKEIKGIIPPVITSFDQEGIFDEAAQREVIRFLLPHIHGFYPTGTYGSGPMMTNEERKKVAKSRSSSMLEPATPPWQWTWPSMHRQPEQMRLPPSHPGITNIQKRI
jgi:hypothetical protein